MLKVNFFILFALTALFARPQTSVNSPYSAFGIGEFDNGSQAPFMSMGNARLAMHDSTLLNISNPASYAFIGRHKPIFNVDMNVRLGNAYTSDESKSIRSSSMNNAVIGLPIAKKWGASFGINPFSQVGYNILLHEPFLDDTIQYRYQGEGGANRVFLGIGYAPIKTEKRDLSFGINASYLFGSAERIRTAILPATGDYFNAKVNNSLRFKDFYFDAGAVFRQSISNYQNISLAIVYNPETKIKTFNDIYSYSFRYRGSSVVNEQIYDTIQFNDDLEGNVVLPQRINIGVTYEIKANNEKRAAKNKDRSFSRLLFNGEIEIQEWSKYREDFDVFTTNFNLQNSMRTSLGIQFTPNDGRGGKKPTQSYFEFINYRLGLRYLSTKLNLNNQNINDFGISFGMGLPIGASSSGASINFGTEFRRRGTTNNGLIQEDYVNFYFGISLIPGRYEDWFVKRKFD